MLDILFRPLRSVLGVGEQAVSTGIQESQHELGDAVGAIHRMSDAIEHHVEVIEGLATELRPLRDSVNELTATMNNLVALMAPMTKAEQGVEGAEQGIAQGFGRVETFLGFRGGTETEKDPPDDSSS